MASLRSAFFTILVLALSLAAYSETILIKGLTVVSMDKDSPQTLSDQAILVSNGKIQSIMPSEDASPPAGARTVNASGKTVIPGLIDMHVHLWDPAELAANLSFGVTTVRNLSGMPFHLKWKRAIEAGELQGPELFTSGPILNGDGPNWQPNHQRVNTTEEARQAVRDQHRQGYRLLKVYSNLNREAYRAILDESRKLGLSVTGHTPEGFRAEGIPESRPFEIPFTDILNDGFQTIEHVESIVWHGLYDRLDLSAAQTLAQTIARSNTPVTPTLIAHHNLLAVASEKNEYLQRTDTDLLNPFISAMEAETFALWLGQTPGTRSDFETFYFSMTLLLHQAGVPLLAGSDSGIFTNIPGRSLIRELELLRQAGLSNYECLQTATTNPALVLNIEQRVGKIAAGFEADLILVDGNPLEDLSLLYTPFALMVNGDFYDQDSLLKLKQKAREGSFDDTQQRVLSGLEAQGSPIPSL